MPSYVLLFPAFGVVAGAEYDNRPEALLAAMAVFYTHLPKKPIFQKKPPNG